MEFTESSTEGNSILGLHWGHRVHSLSEQWRVVNRNGVLGGADECVAGGAEVEEIVFC